MHYTWTWAFTMPSQIGQDISYKKIIQFTATHYLQALFTHHKKRNYSILCYLGFRLIVVSNTGISKNAKWLSLWNIDMMNTSYMEYHLRLKDTYYNFYPSQKHVFLFISTVNNIIIIILYIIFLFGHQKSDGISHFLDFRKDHT